MSNLSNTYTDDNNTDYSKLILKAFSDRKPEIASFIVEQTKQTINIDKDMRASCTKKRWKF